MNSYRNLAERAMSLLNLVLQGVGVMRQQMEDGMERKMTGCMSMKSIRTAADQYPELKEAFLESIQAPISLLNGLFERLMLHEEPVRTGSPTTEEEMDSLWLEMEQVDPTLCRNETTAMMVKNKERFQAFVSHCMVRERYFVSIKKYGKPECEICLPPVLQCLSLGNWTTFLHLCHLLWLTTTRCSVSYGALQHLAVTAQVLSNAMAKVTGKCGNAEIISNHPSP